VSAQPFVTEQLGGQIALAPRFPEPVHEHAVEQSHPALHAPSDEQSIVHIPGPHFTPPWHDVPVHEMSHDGELHVMRPWHAPSPEHVTLQLLAVPQSTPPVHDEPEHVT